MDKTKPYTAPPRPAEYAETRLIDAIMAGEFPANSNLPAERELAALLGVTRPTLREALQRLGRDGWLEIRQGKPTRVRDYWQEGSLGVLGAIARRASRSDAGIQEASWPPDFVAHLLAVRYLLAPAYTRQAVERQAQQVTDLVHGYEQISDLPEDFAAFDWQLHHRLTLLSGNPIFTLILNGFVELYQPMARRYFSSPVARQASLQFYAGLHAAALSSDGPAAEDLTRQVMAKSLELWRQP
jgi:GntR family negative regulator for fad regulon and positive regulator of fabA